MFTRSATLKRLATAAVVTAALAAIPASANAAAVTDQSNPNPGGTGQLVFHETNPIAQTFTAGRTGFLTQVDVAVGSAAPQPATLELRDQAPVNIPGDITYASAAASLGASRTVFAFQPPTWVNAGQKYSFVVTPSAQATFWATNTDFYKAGNMATKAATGGGWAQMITTDLQFSTTVDEQTDTVPPVTKFDATSLGGYTIKLRPLQTDDKSGGDTPSVRCWVDPNEAPASYDDLGYNPCESNLVSGRGWHNVYLASKDRAGNKETPRLYRVLVLEDGFAQPYPS